MPSGRSRPRTPAAVADLLKCRDLADSAARLTCYDSQAQKIEEQIASKELVVIDKVRADEARKGMFGFSVPSVSALFGVGSDVDINQKEFTIAGVGYDNMGKVILRLDDGSVWVQTDDWEVAQNPKKGEKVLIKRGTMGSYHLEFAKQPGIKVKRIS